MPRGNGTGPMGAGPMTGRAAGYCAGFATPGFANFVGGGLGRGMGMGMGRGVRGGGRGGGFGFRNRFYAPGAIPIPTQAPVMTANQEKEYLANEAKALENDLEAIKKRLGELND